MKKIILKTLLFAFIFTGCNNQEKIILPKLEVKIVMKNYQGKNITYGFKDKNQSRILVYLTETRTGREFKAYVNDNKVATFKDMLPYGQYDIIAESSKCINNSILYGIFNYITVSADKIYELQVEPVNCIE